MNKNIIISIVGGLAILGLILLVLLFQFKAENKDLLNKKTDLARLNVEIKNDLKKSQNEFANLQKSNQKLIDERKIMSNDGAFFHTMIKQLKEQEFTKQLSNPEIEEIKQRAKDFEVKPVTKDDIALIVTSKGYLKLVLFPDKAPGHCQNFKKLANSGFYDGTTFHRVIPGFMIQGGDINSRDDNPGNDGTGSPGWTVDAEFNDTKHELGVLSMARSQDPNSAGSQFFICAAAATHLDNQYTAFGKVIANEDVIQTIVNVPRDKRDKPNEPVRILSIRVFDGKTKKIAE